NEIYGFEQIDWDYLSRATTITVVSEYMKQIMLKRSINPVVIANGIPEALLEEVSKADISRMRETLDTATIFTKVARWREDKGWKPAVRAIHNLNKLGESSKLLAHPAMESDRQKITHQAKSLGLVMKNIYLDGDPKKHYLRAVSKQDFTPYFEALSQGSTADILNLLFPLPPSFLRVLYQASDVVLASSGHDPFGLAGMEAIAAGAVVFTSRSAEGHAEHMGNAIVLNNYNAEEIQFYASHLRMHPEKIDMIRASARQTAEQWTWQEVARRLLYKLEYQAQAQGIDLTARAQQG
ncbi:MAG: glycosyltransferase, partial [Desulfatiglandales bacterium]